MMKRSMGFYSKKSLIFAAVLIAVLFLLIFWTVNVNASEEKQNNKIFEVSDTEAFIRAIGSDRVLVLAPGVYNLTPWITENTKDPVFCGVNGDKEAPGPCINLEFDGLGLVINGISDLSIISADPGNPAELVCEPRYADVLKFVCCSDIYLDSLVLGHTPEKGSCEGDVISFEDSESAVVANSELYGCGAYALSAYSSRSITFSECDIHDCTYGCVVANKCNKLRFIRTDFHDCQEYTMFELSGSPAQFIGCSFTNLNGDFTDTDDISLSGCEFNNVFDGFRPSGDEDSEVPYDLGGLNDYEEEGPFINYTVKKHPLELKDRDITLAIGNYNEIVLKDTDKYPKLSKKVEELNKSEEKVLNSFMEDNEEDAKDIVLRNTDGLYFNDDLQHTPIRADDKVFSYYVNEYIFLGGAHGSTLIHCYNIDPSTGEFIPFDAVVKKQDGLADILFKELLDQNEYLEEYYEQVPDFPEDFEEALKDKFKTPGGACGFTIAYDGIWIYYEDYEIGPHAIGTPSEFIAFADYPEIFTDTYVYKGDVPASLADSPMFFDEEPLKTKEVKVHAVLPLYVNWFEEDYFPEKEEDVLDGCSYYTYAVKYSVDSEKYPELAKTLNEYNLENEKTMKTFLVPFKNQIINELDTKEHEPWPIFSRGISLSLCRADDSLLSFTEYFNSDGISGVPFSFATGKNFDANTGEPIDLLDMITSKEALIEAVDKAIEETTLYDKKWKEAAKKHLENGIDSPSLVSGAGLSFTIGYEGITIYIDGDRMGYDPAPSTITLRFLDHPKLFSGPYTNVPKAYATELVTGDHESVYWYDFDGDKKVEPFSLIKERSGKNQASYTLSLRWGESIVPLTEAGEFYSVYSFLMHTEDKDFLYIETDGDYEYPILHIFEINTEAVSLVGEEEACIKFYVWDEHYETTGVLPVTPTHFSMETMDYTLGKNYVVGDYMVSWDGHPLSDGRMKKFTFSYSYNIKATRDISAKYIDESSGSFELIEGTIRKGEYVTPYMLNEFGQLRLKTDDGREWVLTTEKKGDVYTIDGVDIKELFEGLL